jgi:hypothetical protein
MSDDSVRSFSESVAEGRQAQLIRINKRDPEVPAGGIGLRLGAHEALERIDALL